MVSKDMTFKVGDRVYVCHAGLTDLEATVVEVNEVRPLLEYSDGSRGTCSIIFLSLIPPMLAPPLFTLEELTECPL